MLFRSASVGTSSPRQAELTLETNDANSYLAGTIGTQAIERIRDTIARQVNREAAAMLLGSISTIRGNLVGAAAGASQLVDGATTAADGASQLGAGAAQLADGTAEVITGRRQRRNWTDEEKARILAESAEPDDPRAACRQAEKSESPSDCGLCRMLTMALTN